MLSDKKCRKAVDEELKALRRSIEASAPGFLSSLNIYVKTRYGYDNPLLLLFEDPVNFYRILVEYLGSEDGAHYVFERLIAIPLVLRSVAAYRARIHEVLLEAVRRGDRGKALEILEALVCRR